MMIRIRGPHTTASGFAQNRFEFLRERQGAVCGPGRCQIWG